MQDRSSSPEGSPIPPPPSTPAAISLRIQPPPQSVPLLSVMSSANDDFDSQYERLHEIGRGGFSVVYACRERSTNAIYAVKIIDLRPLRLRERFNPTRLRREVDIMRRLKHKNIIQFVNVFETADQLLMVLEYAPGSELFDVILARRYFTENDARPVFSQIARAIYYLHSMNILHRDIKPENVLILESPDPTTGEPVAKLLDFGLSKSAGGSAAKTFVGTPCYLAPEVEYTSKGLGGTYGLPADCWSLGAVLHVMLVARFPEFEQDPITGRVLLKLPPVQWDNVSSDAKDLIRGLMTFEPGQRMTVRQVLQHRWLGSYRVSDSELGVIARKSIDDFSQHGRAITDEEFDEAAAVNNRNVTGSADIFGDFFPRLRNPSPVRGGDNSSSYVNSDSGRMAIDMVDDGLLIPPKEGEKRSDSVEEEIHLGLAVARRKGAAGGGGLNINTSSTNIVVRSQLKMGSSPHQMSASGGHSSPHSHSSAIGHSTDVLQIAPLLSLHRGIQVCIDEAHNSFLEMPQVAAQVRRGATMCRAQLMKSMEMLKKVESTATAVLEMFPDLELALEEGEPMLASQFFDMVRGWVIELREIVHSTQTANQASMLQIQTIVEQSTAGLQQMSSFKSITDSSSSSGSGAVNSNETRNYLYSLSAQVVDTLQQLKGAVNEGQYSHHQQQNMPQQQDGAAGGGGGGMGMGKDISTEQMLELFFNLFSQGLRSNNLNNSGSNNGSNRATVTDGGSSMSFSVPPPPSPSSSGVFPISMIDESDGEFSGGMPSLEERAEYFNTTPGILQPHSIDADMLDSACLMNIPDNTTSTTTIPPVTTSITNPAMGKSGSINALPCMELTAPSIPAPLSNVSTAMKSSPSSASVAAQRLSHALDQLRQIDNILEQLGIFWASTEAVLDLLTKKGQHAEQFISFAQKPRLMDRFKSRMSEYKMFWLGVKNMCNNYVSGTDSNDGSGGGEVFWSNEEQRMDNRNISSSIVSGTQSQGSVSSTSRNIMSSPFPPEGENLQRRYYSDLSTSFDNSSKMSPVQMTL